MGPVTFIWWMLYLLMGPTTFCLSLKIVGALSLNWTNIFTFVLKYRRYSFWNYYASSNVLLIKERKFTASKSIPTDVIKPEYVLVQRIPFGWLWGWFLGSREAFLPASMLIVVMMFSCGYNLFQNAWKSANTFSSKTAIIFSEHFTNIIQNYNVKSVILMNLRLNMKT